MVNRFEDLDVWKMARELSKGIYLLSISSGLKNDFSLRDQIARSAGSVMDNIAEGFERGGRKEFIQFLSYSKGSAGEVRSQLYRMLDKQYLTPIEFERLLGKVETISKMLSSLISYLKTSEIKGFKFQEPDEPYGTQEP